MAFRLAPTSKPFLLMLAGFWTCVCGCGTDGPSSFHLANTVRRVDGDVHRRIDIGTLPSGSRRVVRIRLSNPKHIPITLVARSTCECLTVMPEKVVIAGDSSRAVSILVDLSRDLEFTGNLGITVTWKSPDELTVIEKQIVFEVRDSQVSY